MTDLHDRFRSLDRVPAPDLWSEVTQRASVAPARAESALALNRIAPIALAVSAVLLSVAVVVGLASRLGPEVGPPSGASATPGTSGSPAPSERANVPQDDEPIEPGRTLFRPPWGFAYGSANWIRGDLILTLPTGWIQRHGSGIEAGSTALEAGVAGPLVDATCVADGTGNHKTVDEFVAAITSVPELGATESPVTLARFDGFVVNLTVPVKPECEQGYGWVTGARVEGLPSVEGFERTWLAGSQHELWVLEVDGVTFVVDASYGPDATAAERQALRDIVASAQIQMY